MLAPTSKGKRGAEAAFSKGRAGVGITVSPALRLRLLMVPNFHDTYEGSELQQLQWWIGLTLTP